MRHPAALLRGGPRRHRPGPQRTGSTESGIGRRPLVRNTLLGAVGLLGLPADRAAARPRPGNARSRQARPAPSGSRACASCATSSARPIMASELEIGDLVNAEPEAIFPTEENGYPELEGADAPGREGQGRGHPRPDGARRHHSRPGPRELVRRRHRLLLQDLHPRGLPDLAQRAHHPPPALPVPPVDLRPRRPRQGHLRPGRPPPPPAAHRGGRRGLPRRPERLQRARRGELLGA